MRPYALTLKHKHLPEMQHVLGLEFPPGFMPILGPFFQGMIVSTLLESRLLSRRVTASDLAQTEVVQSAPVVNHFAKVTVTRGANRQEYNVSAEQAEWRDSAEAAARR